MQNTTRWLSSVLLIGLAGLLCAPSCQDKPAAGSPPASGSQDPEPAQPSKEPVRPAFDPQVAGQFYPAEPDKLRAMIQHYLDEAKKSQKGGAGDLLGIIVPHAGYPYSGPVAAFGFQAATDRPIKRVVVLGPAHRQGFSVPALLDAPAYRTPLGDIPIDRQGVRDLAASGAARIDEGRFRNEHALEVELPFLQVALKDFLLVPVMISHPDAQAAQRLAKALKEIFPARDTLFVASTDMSHDFPYDVAVALDENALRFVKALDPQGLLRSYEAFERAGMGITVKDGKPVPDAAQFCGMGPVLNLLEMAKLYGDAQVAVLDRRSSGDIVGDKDSRIVGYSATAIRLAKERPEMAKKAETEKNGHSGSTGDFLNESEKQELLKIARETLEAYVKTKKVKDFEVSSAKLKEPGAAFVTLKKDDDLRGCIGHMEPTDSLWVMIRDRAIDAAVHDPRFPPVSVEELPKISIEISVLSPRVEVKDPLKEIVIGRDGVWLELGFARGVFLPQVPVEQGWTTVEVYLDHLCQKAGIYRSGCWKAENAKIMRFTALVF